MANLTFAAESIFHLKLEVAPLLLQHWHELGQTDLTLDPDWHRFGLMERAGCLAIFTARNETRQLCGYTAWGIHRHLHYRSTVVAQNDLIWLHPDHRRGMAGVRFIRWSEAALKARGVEKIHIETKKNTPMDRLLARIGYTQTGSIFVKGIK